MNEWMKDILHTGFKWLARKVKQVRDWSAVFTKAKKKKYFLIKLHRKASHALHT